MDQDHKQELSFSDGTLSALLHSSTGMDVRSVFTKDIFLVHQAIVGMRFQGGADELMDDLKPGSRVTFLREPDNEYDRKAVMALDEDGRQIGYIPRHQNAVISALMDAGKLFYGIVPDDESREAWLAEREGRLIPGAIYVDLYMREYSSPDDMQQIPRQGDQGSYAVISVEQTETGGICGIYAIKVINGEERGCYEERVSDPDDREELHDLIAGFEHFAGMLPLVGHGIERDLEMQLAEAYGVLLGKALSNRTIDTMVMAENHLPVLESYSLEEIDRELGLLHRDIFEGVERISRMTWELYSRLCRSELEKRQQRNVREIPLQELYEDRRLSPREKIVLNKEGILVIGDLMDRSEDDLMRLRNLDKSSVEKIKEILKSYKVSFSDEDYEPVSVTFSLPDEFLDVIHSTAASVLKETGLTPEELDLLDDKEKSLLVTNNIDKKLRRAEWLHQENTRISALFYGGITNLYRGDYSDAAFSMIKGINGMDMEKKNGYALLSMFHDAWHNEMLESEAEKKMLRVCLTLVKGILGGDSLSGKLDEKTKRIVVTGLCQEAFSYAVSQGISDEDREVLHEIGTLFGRGKMVDEDGEVIETEPNPEISYKAFYYAEK